MLEARPMIYRDDFQFLVERLEASRSKEQAVSALSRYLGTVGVDHYAYLGFGAQGMRGREPFRAGTYPSAWVDEYMGDQLYSVDPVGLAATKSTVPLEWTGRRLASKDSEGRVAEMFERAARFGIRSGYTIPIRSSTPG